MHQLVSSALSQGGGGAGYRSGRAPAPSAALSSTTGGQHRTAPGLQDKQPTPAEVSNIP